MYISPSEFFCGLVSTEVISPFQVESSSLDFTITETPCMMSVLFCSLNLPFILKSPSSVICIITSPPSSLSLSTVLTFLTVPLIEAVTYAFFVEASSFLISTFLVFMSYSFLAMSLCKESICVVYDTAAS